MKTQTQFIVLGAGRPTSYLNPLHSDHLPLHKSGLEWVKQAVKPHVASCHYVAGYHFEDVAAHVGDFALMFNPDWETTGSIASLLTVPLPDNHQVLACYGDIVFRGDIVSQLVEDEADIVFAIDTVWKHRYARRAERDIANAEKVTLDNGTLLEIGRHVDEAAASAEFIGLVKLSPKAIASIRAEGDLGDRLRRTGMLPDLIAALSDKHGLTTRWHDVRGDWAELNAPQDLARFVFGTKAETLGRLKPLAASVQIEDQVCFTVGEWRRSSTGILREIREKFAMRHVIVRSSALAEDSWRTANAGVFSSIGNVDGASPQALRNAIESVIESYGAHNQGDQVLVQRMLQDVVANGVVFTRTLSQGAPYFAVNYDTQRGRTDGVTAGAKELQMLYMHHDAPSLPAGAPAWMPSLMTGVRELVGLVGYDSLDVEFAIDDDNRVYLLQVRPIAVDHSKWALDDALLKSDLDQSAGRFDSLQMRTGNVHGNRAVFGIMPDWNPAEIVGIRPSLLSISLYRYLICDDIWARQRAEYGYKDVRPQPLLVSFAGHPYVNVRASASSFIPDLVPGELADRLVDHYLQRLVSHPELHDKFEFDVAFTCLSLDFDRRARDELRPAGFSDQDIETLRSGLAQVTRHGMQRYGLDFAAIEKLSERFDAVMRRELSFLERACTLLEDCREYGTLAFAHLARGAFVAMTILRSAVTQGFITRDFLESYLRSVRTVASDFVHDSKELARTDDGWRQFLDRYGHLRPGTYDIMSPTYRESGETLLRQSLSGLQAKASNREETSVEWPAEGWAKIQRELERLGVKTDLETFDTFAKAVIEGREYSKFIFSRNLSQALSDLAAYGAEIGVERSILADVPISVYSALRAGEGFGDPAAFIRKASELNAERRKITGNAELPPLIHDRNQFFAFHYPPSQPNFITSKAIVGPIRVLTNMAQCDVSELKGRIIVIPQADPGYDWLFGCEIAGLVTTYGGANSHMAIRSAEFDLPAAIGIGEVKFERLQHASTIMLDCGKRIIEVIQ